MNSVTAIIEKVDNLTIRERAVILVGILAVLYMLWNTFLMQPLVNQQKIIKADLQQKQATQAGLNVQVQKAIQESGKDPNVELEKELQSLKKELNEINTNIQVSTAHLVSPKNMAKILEDVLLKTKGLTLISVKSLGSSALVQKRKDEKGKTGEKMNDGDDKSDTQQTTEVDTEQSGDMSNAYRHGLRIEFEGDYLSTLRYLKDLEALDWKFFWDSFELNVEEYPRSRVSFEVFTLSLDRNWIDV